MDEFVGRMATQRRILDTVNSHIVSNEKLFGLSAATIRRWEVASGLAPSMEVVVLLQKLSSELFFMATRSQEPVSDEYKTRSRNIALLVEQLENIV